MNKAQRLSNHTCKSWSRWSRAVTPLTRFRPIWLSCWALSIVVSPLSTKAAPVAPLYLAWAAEYIVEQTFYHSTALATALGLTALHIKGVERPETPSDLGAYTTSVRINDIWVQEQLEDIITTYRLIGVGLADDWSEPRAVIIEGYIEDLRTATINLCNISSNYRCSEKIQQAHSAPDIIALATREEKTGKIAKSRDPFLELKRMVTFMQYPNAFPPNDDPNCKTNLVMNRFLTSYETVFRKYQQRNSNLSVSELVYIHRLKIGSHSNSELKTIQISVEGFSPHHSARVRSTISIDLVEDKGIKISRETWQIGQTHGRNELVLEDGFSKRIKKCPTDTELENLADTLFDIFPH